MKKFFDFIGNYGITVLSGLAAILTVVDILARNFSNQTEQEEFKILTIVLGIMVMVLCIAVAFLSFSYSKTVQKAKNDEKELDNFKNIKDEKIRKLKTYIGFYALNTDNKYDLIDIKHEDGNDFLEATLFYCSTYDDDTEEEEIKCKTLNVSINFTGPKTNFHMISDQGEVLELIFKHIDWRTDWGQDLYRIKGKELIPARITKISTTLIDNSGKDKIRNSDLERNMLLKRFQNFLRSNSNANLTADTRRLASSGGRRKG